MPAASLAELRIRADRLVRQQTNGDSLAGERRPRHCMRSHLVGCRFEPVPYEQVSHRVGRFWDVIGEESCTRGKVGWR